VGKGGDGEAVVRVPRGKTCTGTNPQDQLHRGGSTEVGPWGGGGEIDGGYTVWFAVAKKWLYRETPLI